MPVLVLYVIQLNAYISTAQPTIAGMNSSVPNNTIILSRRGLGPTSVNIYCTANGTASSVTYQWTLNGGAVPGSYQSMINGVGWLHISPVTPAHGGTYRCTTSNRVGYDFRELTLTVIGRPFCLMQTVS